MNLRWQRLQARFEYPVVFTRGVFDPADDTLVGTVAGSGPRRVLAFVDAGCAAARPDLIEAIAAYARAHADVISLAAPPILVEGGEGCKNDPAALIAVQGAIHEAGIDRHGLVLAVGGGAVLDLVGFAAATIHRGIDLVRVPTTLLAQADSAMGVKCGVNARGVKNLLGAFAPPAAVVVDPGFLSTLPTRELRSGLAEAIKVALVRDRAFFEWIEQTLDPLRHGEPAAIETLMRRSARCHLEHVARCGDPFERGSARPLDFGHWAAHRLEVLSAHRLRHGEAVAIGIAIDAHQSVSAGRLHPLALERIERVLDGLGLVLWDPALELRDGGRPAVAAGLEEFRQHIGGPLCISLLANLGRGVDVHTLDAGWLEAAIDWLSARSPHVERAAG